MLSPTLLPLLRQYGRQDTPQPWRLPGHPRTRPMTTTAVSLVCRQAGEAADLPQGIHPHGLRHTCATPLCEARVELRRSQRWLGPRLRRTRRSRQVTPHALPAPPSPLDAVPLAQAL